MRDLPKQPTRDERRLTEWQLLLLRFAITRDPIDQAAALGAARPLDAAMPQQPKTFNYFERTTSDVCVAITGVREEHERSILQRFIARIEDERLKAAFLACLDMEQKPSRAPRRAAAWRDRQGLWRGLPKR